MGISKNLIPTLFKPSIDISEEILFEILEKNSTYLREISTKRIELIRKLRTEKNLEEYLNLSGSLYDLIEEQIEFLINLDETLSSIMRSINRNYKKIYLEEIIVVDSRKVSKQKTTLKELFKDIKFNFKIFKQDLVKKDKSILKQLKKYHNELIDFFEHKEKNAELIDGTPLSFTDKGKKLYLRRLIEVFKNNKSQYSYTFSRVLDKNLQYIVYAFDSNQLNTSFKFTKSHYKQISDFFTFYYESVEWTKLVEENNK